MANFETTTLGGIHGARIIIEQRRQPTLGFRKCPILAAGVIFYLVALDLADAEIAAFGMSIIEARHRRTRPHGIAFGQLDADLVGGVQQLEQSGFLRMFRLGGITRRRTDAGIGLLDQLFVAELFLWRIAPIVLAH